MVLIAGCAWNPEHRSPFEFCENGAKAVADEAMKANVNRKFFAKYTVKELSQRVIIGSIAKVE